MGRVQPDSLDQFSISAFFLWKISSAAINRVQKCFLWAESSRTHWTSPASQHFFSEIHHQLLLTECRRVSLWAESSRTHWTSSASQHFFSEKYHQLLLTECRRVSYGQSPAGLIGPVQHLQVSGGSTHAHCSMTVS